MDNAEIMPLSCACDCKKVTCKATMHTYSKNMLDALQWRAIFEDMMSIFQDYIVAAHTQINRLMSNR